MLAAKVKGALILDALIGPDSLDFFVVFSSIASHLGLPGQIDYSAANAYLDHFAEHRSARAKGLSLAIKWNIWADIGMAAQASQHLQASWPRLKLSQGLWDFRAVANAQESYFSFSLNTEHWLLAEHKTKQDEYLIPGTGYIELFRAAAEEVLGAGPIEIENVQFMSAFALEPQQQQDLYLHLEDSNGQLSMSIFSLDEELPHATAYASRLNQSAGGALDLAALRQNCQRALATDGRHLVQHFMDFGPRWACIDSINLGAEQAVLELSLSPEFEGDLELCGLHPAVLDMATGAVQSLMPGFDPERDFYVPVAYEKLWYSHAMPAACVSYVQAKTSSGPEGLFYFDISLADASGQVFLQINNFCMKKMESGFALQQATTSQATQNLLEILQQGILAHEGAEAFARIMASGAYANCIISSVDSEQWAHALEEADLNPEAGQISYVHEELHDADADEDIAQIEQALVAHQSIEQVVVRSFLDEENRRRLIAFYQPDDWEPVTVTELRKFAAEQLAQDLVPQHFVEWDELPQQGEGGIDRAALLDPFAPIDSYIAPSTTVQKQLAQIWQSALGVERVSLTDNFFDVGGHSLLAIRVMMKAKKRFGVRLEQAQLAMMTLEQMAAVIESHKPAAASQSEVQSQSALQEQAPSTAQEPLKATAEAGSAGEVKGAAKKGLLKSLFKRK